MGFPFKVLGGFITTKDDIAVLTSGGIFIKNKDTSQLVPVLQEFSQTSVNSGILERYTSIYTGISSSINLAFSKTSLYLSSQISQWAKSSGALPSESISDMAFFNNRLYVCTNSGLYTDSGSIVSTGNFNFSKVIFNYNDSSRPVNAIGVASTTNEDGASIDQLILLGDSQGNVYTILVNDEESVTNSIKTNFSVIHKIIRVNDDWIISSYNQFKFLDQSKVYTLSLGVDV